MADLRIFSYLPNPRLYKATIAARFSGAEIEIRGDAPPKLADWLWDFDPRPLSDEDKEGLSHFARNASMGFSGALYKSDAFLAAHPFGSVPAGFSGDGTVGIFESNAIMRAAARCGPHAPVLLGEGPMEQSRVDAFLDRSLVFARDSQRYLLARAAASEALYGEMTASLLSYADGLDRALSTSTHIACDTLTLADIAAACELCLMTVEGRFAKGLIERGLEPITPHLAGFRRLGDHMIRLARDDRFNDDLGPFFDRLLPIWS